MMTKRLLLELAEITYNQEESTPPPDPGDALGLEFLGLLEDLYKVDGNPLYAWAAYRIARKKGDSVPEWVLSYFDSSSLALFQSLKDHNDSGSDVKNPSSLIAECLKMKGPGRSGRGNVFSSFGEASWLFYASLVAGYMRMGEKEYIAIENAAEFLRVSPATVRRAWKKFESAYFRDEEDTSS
ncbi:hypothetical protein [Fodinicurvata fenggangensis]|uniref:hypothetical protein n=1 Tax=Fodinicurvata fenggangensis TaxID=1121830 RepID=UPI0012DE5BBE|nr:hypothetical protein [Fodinicurvata fenggangensis]